MKTWSPLEFDILETLTRRIRLMADQQMAQTANSAIKAIDRLLRAELLLTTTINARPIPNAPYISWEAGDESPDINAVWQNVLEHSQQASLPMRVYWAAPQTANLFGVKGGSLSSISERNNDLRLAQAYVEHHARFDQSHWLGATIANNRIAASVPVDAAIIGSDGVLKRVIVIARSESQRLWDFHAACVSSATAYEVW